MSRGLRSAGLAAVFTVALAAAPAALAAPTVSITMGNHLTVTGDGSSETYVITTVQDPGGSVSVTGPAPMTPPAGCTGNMTSTLVTCPSSTAAFVDLAAAGGSDTITVSDPRTTVTAAGNVGNDTLNAGSTPLSTGITGGPDDDTFNGSDSQADAFAAEAGNDTYHGGTATPPAAADPATYQIQNVADQYFLSGSTPGSVSLDGSANDSDGQGGTDNVGIDVEQVDGADGNDTLSAGPNAAVFRGGAGDDTLSGSPEADTITGGDGSDRISGNAGDDELSDGDRLGGLHGPGATFPPVGNDSIDGGPGNDAITEWFGADDVVGGAGDDTVDPARLVDESADLSVFPPPHTHYQPLTISLDDQPNDGATGQNEGDNIHADVENVDASRESNIFFTADPGSDTITGSAAANRITTASGDDTVLGGGGADVIKTRGGADTISAVDQTTDVVNCGAGADSVSADLPGEDPPRADALYSCETVTGTPLPAPTFTLPDSKRPKLALSGPTTLKAKSFLRSFVLRVRVACDQPCAVTGEMTIAGARFAKVGDLSIGAGSLKRGTGKRTLKVKVAKRYRSSLRRKLRTRAQRRKGIKLSVAVTATNASRQSRTASRTLRVRG